MRTLILLLVAGLAGALIGVGIGVQASQREVLQSEAVIEDLPGADGTWSARLLRLDFRTPDGEESPVVVLEVREQASGRSLALELPAPPAGTAEAEWQTPHTLRFAVPEQPDLLLRLGRRTTAAGTDAPPAL
jgi:hypothetical protein